MRKKNTGEVTISQDILREVAEIEKEFAQSPLAPDIPAAVHTAMMHMMAWGVVTMKKGMTAKWN